jgi:hypothetical protein
MPESFFHRVQQTLALQAEWDLGSAHARGD